MCPRCLTSKTSPAPTSQLPVHCLQVAAPFIKGKSPNAPNEAATLSACTHFLLCKPTNAMQCSTAMIMQVAQLFALETSAKLQPAIKRELLIAMLAALRNSHLQTCQMSFHFLQVSEPFMMGKSLNTPNGSCNATCLHTLSPVQALKCNAMFNSNGFPGGRAICFKHINQAAASHQKGAAGCNAGCLERFLLVQSCELLPRAWPYDSHQRGICCQWGSYAHAGL